MASKDKKTKTKDNVEKIVNEVIDNDEWEALQINNGKMVVTIRQEHLSYKNGCIVHTQEYSKTYFPTSTIITYTLLDNKIL